MYNNVRLWQLTGRLVRYLNYNMLYLGYLLSLVRDQKFPHDEKRDLCEPHISST